MISCAKSITFQHFQLGNSNLCILINNYKQELWVEYKPQQNYIALVYVNTFIANNITTIQILFYETEW